MTREEKIKRAAVAMAWAEGKAVQFRMANVPGDGEWKEARDYFVPAFFSSNLEWRIKSEPKLRPWTIESFPKNRPVWVRNKNRVAGANLVAAFFVEGVKVFPANDYPLLTWKELASDWEQSDGSPCGVVE